MILNCALIFCFSIVTMDLFGNVEANKMSIFQWIDDSVDEHVRALFAQQEKKIKRLGTEVERLEAQIGRLEADIGTDWTLIM